MVSLKEHHRPLTRFRIISVTSFVMHLTAFLLLLLVGLSMPIIKPIDLIKLQADTRNQPPTSIVTELRFGVWGVCASSVLDTGYGECTKARLGYTIPTEYLNAIGLSTALADAIMTSLLIVLILHLIAAIFAFLAFIVSLFLASQVAAIIGLILSIITGILSTLMLGVDLGLVLIVRNKVEEFTNGGFVVQWGNGVWMVLVAAILTWIGVIFLSARTCYCFGVRRKDDIDTY